MATKQYVMTVMATNRVGILAALATALDELGGGFVDLSQAIMRDYFTIIMAVEFPENRHPDVIVDHIRAVCRPFGIDLMLRDPSAEPHLESTTEPVELHEYLLRMKGQDRPGVLRRISLRLAQEGINITDLYGERDDESGTFESSLALEVPTGVNIARLQAELDQALKGEGVSISVARCDVLKSVTEPWPSDVAVPLPAGAGR